jgi:hypothetical protein
LPAYPPSSEEGDEWAIEDDGHPAVEALLARGVELEEQDLPRDLAGALQEIGCCDGAGPQAVELLRSIHLLCANLCRRGMALEDYEDLAILLEESAAHLADICADLADDPHLDQPALGAVLRPLLSLVGQMDTGISAEREPWTARGSRLTEMHQRVEAFRQTCRALIAQEHLQESGMRIKRISCLTFAGIASVLMILASDKELEAPQRPLPVVQKPGPREKPNGARPIGG